MFDNQFRKSEETWNQIAKSFDQTRRKPWKQIVDFINGLKSSDIVADIGCGNGRHLGFILDKCRIAIGVDISRNLLKITENKIYKTKQNMILVQGNNVYLPIIDESIDAVIYIAALHNIKGRLNRINSLNEINRILKKDGIALISVWSRGQEKFKSCIFQTSNEDHEFGDIEIFWRQNNLNVPRFYHLYSKQEFIEDIKRSKLKIEDISEVSIQSKKSVDNYFAFVRK